MFPNLPSKVAGGVGAGGWSIPNPPPGGSSLEFSRNRERFMLWDPGLRAAMVEGPVEEGWEEDGEDAMPPTPTW